MHSIGAIRKAAPAWAGLFATLAAAAACKTSTASGASSASGADAGIGDRAAIAASDAGAQAGDAGTIARDVGQGAGTAAGSVGAGVESAAHGIADAGAAAYGAAAGAATTAAEAARQAAEGARGGAAPALDGGASGETAGTADAGTAGSAPLSDAQIAAVAVTANQVDIEAARLAKRKSKNAKVKKFANDMIRDHTSANKQATALVKKLGVTPEENQISRAIAKGGEDNLDELRSMKGKQFDRAYAEHEVAYHQEVLGALDERLIPSAQDGELKSLLQSVRAVVKQHLDHAAALAESLSK